MSFTVKQFFFLLCTHLKQQSYDKGYNRKYIYMYIIFAKEYSILDPTNKLQKGRGMVEMVIQLLFQTSARCFLTEFDTMKIFLWRKSKYHDEHMGHRSSFNLLLYIRTLSSLHAI